MKILLKSLGLILMVLGALIMIVIFATGSDLVNNNAVLGGCLALMIIGLIAYIVINKKMVE